MHLQQRHNTGARFVWFAHSLIRQLQFRCEPMFLVCDAVVRSCSRLFVSFLLKIARKIPRHPNRQLGVRQPNQWSTGKNLHDVRWEPCDAIAAGYIVMSLSHDLDSGDKSYSACCSHCSAPGYDVIVFAVAVGGFVDVGVMRQDRAEDNQRWRHDAKNICPSDLTWSGVVHPGSGTVTLCQFRIEANGKCHNGTDQNYRCWKEQKYKTSLWLTDIFFKKFELLIFSIN